jgi:subtilisin
MGKRRIVAGVVLSVSMAFSFSSGTNAEVKSSAKDVSSDKTYRVLIQGSQSEKTKVKKNMGAHRDFNSQGFTTDVSEEEYNKLLDNKNIKVEKVPEFKIAATSMEKATSAPSTRVPWGIKAIYNNSSLTSTTGGSGIKVAVLDTGVLKTHASLSSNIEQCKDFTQTSSTVVNGSCADGNGHGTHVAGTVAGNGGGSGVYGVAPQSKVWAYKVLGDDGSGYSDDIAAAIRHAADQASSTGSKVIISMSLGSSSNNSLISSAVTYAYGKGVLIIAAAGNSGSSANTIGYPGALANVVAVAALENVQQNGTYRVANYSSRGNPSTDGDYVIGLKDVEISAPGSAVESTWHTGGYNTISGTSMATPHVSGLAAKIWASNTGYSPTQLRAELQRRAKLYDIKGGTGAATGDDYASGFGFARVQ